MIGRFLSALGPPPELRYFLGDLLYPLSRPFGSRQSLISLEFGLAAAGARCHRRAPSL